MEKQHYSLIEVANELKKSVADLVELGAQGKLTIHAIADEWKGKDDQGTDVTIDAVAADLDRKDLIKALNADHVIVRRVRVRSGGTITLDPPQKIMRGVLQVAADERERVLAAHRSADESDAIDETSLQDRPSYLDPSDENYSEKLAAAVGAWMALYADGGFRSGTAHKKQILDWLRANHSSLSATAQEQIATVVNPNPKGGKP